MVVRPEVPRTLVPFCAVGKRERQASLLAVMITDWTQYLMQETDSGEGKIRLFQTKYGVVVTGECECFHVVRQHCASSCVTPNCLGRQ